MNVLVTPLLALLACDGGGDDDGPAIVPAPIVEGVTWRAVVTTAPRDPPTRFTAGFPPSPEALRTEPWAWPSRDDLRRGICDTPRLRDAVEPTPEWLDVLGDCQPFMVDETYCAWALQLVDGLPAGHTLLIPACAGDPSVRAAVADPGSPYEWVAFWSQTSGHPGIERAVAAVTPNVEAGRLFGTDLVILEALAEDADPRAGAALLALHDKATDPAVRRAIGHVLWGRDDPAMQAAHAAACAAETAHWCEWTRSFEPYYALQAVDFDLERARQAHPQFSTALDQELVDCAGDRWSHVYAEGAAALCLRALARSDPARARAIAEQRGTDDYNAVAAVVSDPAAVPGWLVEAGFGPLDDVAPAEPLLPIEWLVASGEARAWPDWFRYDPDAAAWSLAELVGFAGLDAHTAVVSRADIEPSDLWRPRRVHFAWMDGLRFRALGAPVDQDFEPERVVGFVNALLHHRGSPVRIAHGYAGGSPYMVRGTPAAIQALVDAHHLWPYDPPPRSPVAAAELSDIDYDL